MKRSRCQPLSRPMVIKTIGNAVLWAVVILVVSWVSKNHFGLGNATSYTFTGLLIAGWYATHELIQNRC